MNILKPLYRLLNIAVIIDITAMLLLTIGDVALRNLFRKSIPGSFEMTQFLLALLVFFAMIIVTIKKEHIVVGLFENWLNSKFKLQLIAFVGSIFGFLLIAFQLFDEANILDKNKHVTGFMEWPIAPIVYVMCVLAGICGLIVFYQMISFIRNRNTPETTNTKGTL